tara:strand:+ start:80 stop:1489 length:1410 start_codon:yes stop_codon:yes gene_type:complete
MWTKIKIVCTIGPKTCLPKTLLNLKKNGMNLIRLNGSHGTLSWHKKVISRIRKIMPEIPIIFDLPGQKIRVTNIKVEKKINLGQKVVFTSNQNNKDHKKITINNPILHKNIKNKTNVYADDGNLRLKLLNIKGKDIVCIAKTNGKILPGQGINFILRKKNNALISNNEKKFILFANKNSVDYIGVSYAKSKKHVLTIQKYIYKKNIRVISKIEDIDGLNNLEEIIQISDAIMIDRGDLSVSPEINNVTVVQKQIIKLCNKYSKPSIVATELLESMFNRKTPTKSEISDITNAIYDGCSATMLSAETAISNSPETFVKAMQNIIHSVTDEKVNNIKDLDSITISKGISTSASILCKNLPINKIVAITKTGYAARILSNSNINQKIYAVTPTIKNARSFNLIKNTEGIFYKINFDEKSTDHIIHCLKHLWKLKKIVSTDLILVVAVGYPKKGNTMNLIQIHRVFDLISKFK